MTAITPLVLHKKAIYFPCDPHFRNYSTQFASITWPITQTPPHPRPQLATETAWKYCKLSPECCLN